MQLIGEFYREKVLLRDDLIRRELPYRKGDIRIDQDLFGWKLYAGNQYIECRSEEEARYLKPFLELGFSEVYVPKDEEYLKSILPQWEYLKRRTYEIMDDVLEGVLSRKIRGKVRSAVLAEILDVGDDILEKLDVQFGDYTDDDEVESMDGKTRRDLIYSAAGAVLEIEEGMQPSDLPGPVSSAVFKAYPGGVIKSAEKLTRGSFVGYELTVRQGKKTHEVVLDSGGTIQKTPKGKSEKD